MIWVDYPQYVRASHPDHGSGSTVITVLAVRPPQSTVIVAVPGERAVTRPVRASTEATRGSLLDHTWHAGPATGTSSAARS